MYLQETASPWLDPRFMIVAVPLAVGLIAWFLRGEFQSKANATRQKEHEEADAQRHAEIIEYVDEVRDEHRDLKRAFYSHATDTKVHHNEAMFKEFREGLDRRLTGFESTLQEISRKLDSGHRTQ